MNETTPNDQDSARTDRDLRRRLARLEREHLRRTVARRRLFRASLGVCMAGLMALPVAAMAVTPTHSFSAGDPILASEMNDNFEDLAGAITDLEPLVGAAVQHGMRLDELERGIVPVGAVVDWWRPNDIPLATIPDGYVVCDGSVIEDGDSPLDGLTTPDLTGRFVRGITDAGDMTVGEPGGSDSHAHPWAYIDGLADWHTWADDGSNELMISYSNGVGDEGSGVYAVGTVGFPGSFFTAPIEHVPSHVGLLKLMRIK